MTLLILHIVMMLVSNSNTPDFIQEYHKALTKEKEQEFIAKYEKSNEIDIKAYVVSFKMKQAKYERMPWNKMKVFTTYKNQLEELISKHPGNMNLRYVRLVIQENVPSILNYSSDIENDKAYLSKMMKRKDDTDYLDPYIKKNTSL
ncbi:hypothetical protein F6U93_05920 [Tamlana haliotis]|uniref:Uncharacterized protein n=1 Tax=Pseudotamlana haliotis TaxID=2614804 RepID=A0A6N6MI08_9FLAO|nr:hypothetical protein [Tamlana haliotis]KAB1068654.1 hypothetical protein F6U93_05920 [Tamlana haliotis]